AHTADAPKTAKARISGTRAWHGTPCSLSAVAPPAASWLHGPLRQERLRFLDLDAVGIGVLSERGQLLEIIARLGGVAGGLRRLRRAVKRAQAIRRGVQ